jgi:DNA-binding response OmpR family regulator
MNKPFAFIIEDDPQIAQIFELTLQNHFAVEQVNDGSLALLRLETLTPDLIVLDLNLPSVNGRDILYWIRKDRRFEHTHIFLCTADAVQGDMLQNEADIVLLKPVSPLQLREMAMRFIPAGE